MKELPQSIIEKFKSEKLLPAIAQDAQSKQVLMQAWVSKESLESTIESGFATYWSRSRNSLWRKGESSGNHQRIIRISYDCDSDSILFEVEQTGPACHTGNASCFHNSIDI